MLLTGTKPKLHKYSKCSKPYAILPLAIRGFSKASAAYPFSMFRVASKSSESLRFTLGTTGTSLEQPTL